MAVPSSGGEGQDEGGQKTKQKVWRNNLPHPGPLPTERGKRYLPQCLASLDCSQDDL
jgi:hypothetical protein